MRVMVWGGSGLVGSACVRYLLKDPSVSQVLAPSRRPLSIEHARLFNPVVDFARVPSSSPLFDGVDTVISALGTTIKQAGSREKFRQIDFDYNLAIARVAREMEIPRYCLVSAVGADKDSLVFYSRIKGELEDQVRQLGFRAHYFYRPGLLIGEREHFRLGESLAIKTSGVMNLLMQGPLKPFRAIPGDVVGKALARNAVLPPGDAGAHVCFYPEIMAMAGNKV